MAITGLAAADGEPPSTSRYVLPLPSSKLQSITAPPGGKKPGTIAAYLALVEGRRGFIPLLWLLMQLRYAPVWIFPLLTGAAIDRLAHAPTAATAVHALAWILPATAALCLINIFSTIASVRMLSAQRRSLSAGLRRSLMARLHRLTFSFHDQARAGELANKFLLDVGRLEGLQHYLSEFVLMQSSTALLMLALVGWKDPALFAVIALAAPINIALARVMWLRMKRENEEFRIAESGFVSLLHEALNGLRMTRIHAVEDWTEQRVGSSAGRVAEVGVRVDTLTAVFASSSWTLSQFINMTVFGLGVWRCAHGEISIGDLGVFMAYYAMIYSSVAALVNGMPTVAQASDAITSLAELYRDDNEERNAGKPALPAMNGEIELAGVGFRYEKSDHHSLQGLDLRVPAGTSLALVGASGSGKSTIASLILGLYEPQAGTVAIDGHDLATIDRRSLRKHVGVVSQDVVLFHDTVLGNIAWGDRKPDEARARAAATRANALGFIEKLPAGFATMLGDRGTGLSGGQRQRLAIARALYRDPKLLILDEATSALDPESERLVQAALDELMKGRTTLIIAHRLSTVRSADRIAVIDQGRVCEIGTYAELIAKQGAFWRLAQGQLPTVAG
ncbi:MAG TPA: ABC transporter ATP-binding protein [Planctomycetota bacterium]|nr:ABC transporter ATP-binding protein [Planctomycetota bacterium]